MGVHNLSTVLGGGGGGAGFITKSLYPCNCLLRGNSSSFFTLWFSLTGLFLGPGLLLFGEIDTSLCSIVLKSENGTPSGSCFWGDLGDGQALGLSLALVCRWIWLSSDLVLELEWLEDPRELLGDTSESFLESMSHWLEADGRFNTLPLVEFWEIMLPLMLEEK